MSAAAAHSPSRHPRDRSAFVMMPSQIRWIGVMLFGVQLPLVPYVPAWVSAFGLLLVSLRFLLLHLERRHALTPSRPASHWLLLLAAVVAAFAIRVTFGYIVGRDPCVAFLYILLGIKFLESRSSRDGAFLVCLSGFLLLSLFFYSQSVLSALLMIPALLLITAVLLQLTVPPGQAQPLGAWRRVIPPAAKLLLQGIPLAALLFVFFPRLSAPLWGLPTDARAKTGLSDRMSPGLISELSQSDAVAFRVDFDSDPPPVAQRYWRGPVFSRFDGREWSASARAPGRLERPATTPVWYTVTLEPSGKRWLFALDLPSSLPAAEDDADAGTPSRLVAQLTLEQQLLARMPVDMPVRYRQSSVLTASYAAGRGVPLAAEAQGNVELPSRVAEANPRTVALAREMRARHGGDLAVVQAILLHFRNEPFVYTLTPPILASSPLDGFLFGTRRGFCEHYASAFVVLLRAAGIPARVVTGYQGGEINPRGGYMIVRQSDAHAWAEALIDGRWRRFDPTAAVSPSRIEVGLGAALPAGEPVPLLARLDATWLKTLQLAWDAANHGWRKYFVGYDNERQRVMYRAIDLDRRPPWLAAALVTALGFAWLAGLLGWLAWRRRRYDPAQALWLVLCRRLRRAGLPRDPGEGPLDYSLRAAGRWPEFAAAFRVIGDAYAELRYGPLASSPEPAGRKAALARLGQSLRVLPSARALARRAAAAPATQVAGT